MSYASIAEAHGVDFASQVNAKDSFKLLTQQSSLNPSRSDNTLPGSRYGDQLSRSYGIQDAHRRAASQSKRDRRTQHESFASISPEFQQNHMKKSEFRPWGDQEEIEESWDRPSTSLTLSPQQYLQQSLVGNGNLDRSISGFPPGSIEEERVRSSGRRKQKANIGSRIYTPFNAIDDGSEDGRYLEPVGYGGPTIMYESDELIKTPCQDYFYHLDTCRRCQKKLKKRVIRYFKVLQRNQLNPLLPGTQGLGAVSLDKELFTDYDEMDEMMAIARQPPGTVLQNKRGELCLDPKPQQIEKDDLKEDFANIPVGYDYTPAMFLLIFGLLVIYALDHTGDILKGGKNMFGDLKIVRS